MKRKNVAVIGAGVAGLNCARLLNENSIEVTVFDKGRHLGGRLASRTRDQHQFDYGAQYFTVRHETFAEFLTKPIEDKEVQIWNARFAKFSNGQFQAEENRVNRYVAVPAMRSLGELIAKGLNYKLRHKVTSVERVNEQWKIIGFESQSETEHQFETAGFDFIVLNMPPEQANCLISNESLQSIILQSCVAFMISFESELKLSYDAILLDDDILSWVARDSSKPGRPEGERWVLHGAPDWSTKALSTDDAPLMKVMLEHFSRTFNLNLPIVKYSKIHKWKYALPQEPSSSGYIFDQENNLGICGDWCSEARVEGAFVSGKMLSEKIIKYLA